MHHKIGLKTMDIRNRGKFKPVNSLAYLPACSDFNPVGMFKSAITEAPASPREMDVSNIYHVLEMTDSFRYRTSNLSLDQSWRLLMREAQQCAVAVRKLFSPDL